MEDQEREPLEEEQDVEGHAARMREDDVEGHASRLKATEEGTAAPEDRTGDEADVEGHASRVRTPRVR